MAYNHEYPYSDNQVNNTDWEINKVKELDHKVNTMLSSAIEKAIDAYFNKIMIDAIYNEDDREILLKKEIIVADGMHVYDAGEATISIEG